MKITSKRVLGWATKALQVGSEVADVAVHLQRGVGPLGMVAVGARLLHTVQKLVPQVETEWFVDQGWKSVSLPLAVSTQVQKLPRREVGDDGEQRYIYMVHGHQVGMYKSALDPTFWRPPDTKLSEWRAAIGRYLWEGEGSSWAVWQKAGKWCSGSDPHVETFPSETATQVYEDAKLFLSKGFSRSILFYGGPGVGKSHLMRRVRDLVGGYSLRFEAAALADFPGDCLGLAQILRPDVILIDDIDRTAEPSQRKGQATLAFLEQVRDSVKLVMASANFLDEMDPASLRAGRWDQIVEVERLDADVVERLIGEDVPNKHRARLRKLPVAYVHEFHRRRAALGLDLALDSVENLVAQAEKVAELCARRASSK